MDHLRRCIFSEFLDITEVGLEQLPLEAMQYLDSGTTSSYDVTASSKV